MVKRRKEHNCRGVGADGSLWICVELPSSGCSGRQAAAHGGLDPRGDLLAQLLSSYHPYSMQTFHSHGSTLPFRINKCMPLCTWTFTHQAKSGAVVKVERCLTERLKMYYVTAVLLIGDIIYIYQTHNTLIYIPCAGDWAAGRLHWGSVCVLLTGAQRPELERGSHLEPLSAVV